MQTIITHNGGFHADDVFAVATLQLHLGEDNLRVVRTRDESLIEGGDWVLDVGGVYDPRARRFDHHQKGAPVRENGIPYAAFGLVWKEVGVVVAGSEEIAREIEEKLVLPIDANDNGVILTTTTELDIRPTTLSDMVALLNPVRGSGGDVDSVFMEVVAIARRIIESAIVHATARAAMRAHAEEVYQNAVDTRVLEFEGQMSSSLLIDYPEVLFMVCPDDPATSSNWVAVAISKEKNSYETRLPFPLAWAGLRDSELASVSGIDDAVFCHRNRFLFVAKSREGVMAAVEKTLQG